MAYTPPPRRSSASYSRQGLLDLARGGNALLSQYLPPSGVRTNFIAGPPDPAAMKGATSYLSNISAAYPLLLAPPLHRPTHHRQGRRQVMSSSNSPRRFPLEIPQPWEFQPKGSRGPQTYCNRLPTLPMHRPRGRPAKKAQKV